MIKMGCSVIMYVLSYRQLSLWKGYFHLKTLTMPNKLNFHSSLLTLGTNNLQAKVVHFGKLCSEKSCGALFKHLGDAYPSLVLSDLWL